MILTAENYYSAAANQKYMSVSQYKDFMKCEAMAMAKLQGTYQQKPTTALLVGSYVDSHFEGTLTQFVETHPEIFKANGELKKDYAQAEEIIKRVSKDKLFMAYMSGEKQRIFTASLFRAPWKIKIDALSRNKIVDLKVMRSMDRVMGKSFVEYWGYDLQLAIYAEVERRQRRRKKQKETYLAVATKEEPVNLEIICVPEWRREECLAEVENNMPRILKIKSGEIEPERCEICPYCRATKELKKPIDFELVGFSAQEKKIMKGVF